MVRILQVLPRGRVRAFRRFAIIVPIVIRRLFHALRGSFDREYAAMGCVSLIARWFHVLVVGLVVSLASGCGQDPEIAPASGTSGSGSVDPETALEGGAASPSAQVKPKSRVVGDRMAGLTYVKANVTPQEPSPFRYTNIQPESGVDFKHVSGMTPEKYFPTSNGSGVAMFDYDGDGKMDLYFGSYNPMPPDQPMTGRNRLYRNLGDGKFEDVTDRAGVGYVGRCHGVMAADLDNDGHPDLLLSNYGPKVLYRNNGDGTFTDVTAGSGMEMDGWSSGSAVLDYDNDGDLDVYVANYGDWHYPQDDKFCGDLEANLRMYCSPREIRLVQHQFFRNEGGMKFTEVAAEAGLTREPSLQGHGFGIVTCDLDDDGDMDLYIANDMNPNFLFLNNGDGTFTDATELSGAAYDDKGNAQSGMGVDAEDIDGDGLPELMVTNFANEYNTLYQNLGNGVFYDQTPAWGLAADTMPWVSWGTGFIDVDNDGWPDVFTANGHVDDNREGQSFGEPALLFRNVPLDSTPTASRKFKISTRDVGAYFTEEHTTRGCAFGDLNDDGALDIVTNNYNAHPGILRNDTPSALTENKSIRLKLIGTKSNRDAIGVKLEIQAGELLLKRQVRGGRSLESSHDPRQVIGIGPNAKADRVVIRWPSGTEQIVENLEAGPLHTIEEPTATSVAATEPAGR